MEVKSDETKLLSMECLPLSNGRKTELSTSLQTFHIKLDSVYGLKQPSTIADYHIQAILFDQKYGTFVGNCWKGKPVQNEISQVIFNQNVYFYTSIPVEDLFLVIELICPSQVPNRLKSCGWACLTLTKVEEGEDNEVHKKMPLVHGSPISLIPSEGISKKSGKKKKKKDTEPLLKKTSIEVTFSLAACPLLLDISHLIPQNVLFDAATEIPGLIPAAPNDTLDASYCLKPHLQRCITFVLERLCIRMSSSCEEVDKDIVEKFQLHQATETGFYDFKATQLQVALPPKGTIVQRRLQVAVHNGYCFIQDPDMYHLHIEPPVTPTISKSLRRASSMGTLSGCKEESLVVRSDIKLAEVPDDPNILIVFLLEYIISLPDTKEEKPHISSSLNKGTTATVPVVWGFCQLGTMKENPSQNISLTCNPSLSPHKIFFLKTGQEFRMTLSAFSLLKKTTTNAEPTSDIYSSNKSETSHFRPFSHSTPKHKSLADIPMSIQKPSHSNGLTVFPKSEYENKFSLQEVTLVPSSLPVVPPLLHSFPLEPSECFQTFAKLYWDQLQPVLDHQGKSASVIDASVPYRINDELELHCPPQRNECMLQFLALSCLSEKAEIPSDVFFTFQFYRFLPIRSESLLLKQLSDDESKSSTQSSMVYALYKNQERNPQLGFQVTYVVDPSELNKGEYKSFVVYLMKQTVHVDLWNGQTLLYFGTVAIPLKYLCRQGKGAVVSNLELDILNCEYPDESLIQGKLPAKTPVGKLHMRLASICHPLPTKALEKLEDRDEVFSSVIIQPKIEEKSKDIPAPTVSRAHRIAEMNKELSKLLSSRSVESKMSPDPELTEERRRKLARMEAVRSMENDKNIVNTGREGLHFYLKERQKDLQSIDSYIEKNKTEIIQSFLHSSVTTKKWIYPIIGTKTFFEFVIENPFQVPKKVEILWKCPDLHLVVDLKMWKTLRNLHSISHPMDALSLSDSNPNTPTLLVGPLERIHVPFTYNCVSTQTSQLDLLKIVSGHHFTTDLLSSIPAFNSIESCVKVRFITEDQTLLAVLNLQVQPLPPSHTQVFKFLSMEHSMFKNSIQLNRDNNNKFSTLCSNPEVACTIQENQDMDNSINLHIKAPTKASGKSLEFYVFIYKDKYQIVPCQTWRISVCPLQRMDLSCVAGQLMRSSLLIRGTHATSLMKCSASSKELQLHPSEPFVLSPFAVQELSMNIRLLVPGLKYFQIAMANQSLEQVFQSWLLVLSCQKPSVSKAFQVHLALGKETAKRITYINPYHQERNLVLYSSHPQLLQLRENYFSVGPTESYCIGLYFVPQDFFFTETIFLYLNDSTSDKNEETYCIKIICQ